MIADEPVLAGAVKLMTADALPAVAVTPDGAPGGVDSVPPPPPPPPPLLPLPPPPQAANNTLAIKGKQVGLISLECFIFPRSGPVSLVCEEYPTKSWHLARELITKHPVAAVNAHPASQCTTSVTYQTYLTAY